MTWLPSKAPSYTHSRPNAGTATGACGSAPWGPSGSGTARLSSTMRAASNAAPASGVSPARQNLPGRYRRCQGAAAKRGQGGGQHRAFLCVYFQRMGDIEASLGAPAAGVYPYRRDGGGSPVGRTEERGHPQEPILRQPLRDVYFLSRSGTFHREIPSGSDRASDPRGFPHDRPRPDDEGETGGRHPGGVHRPLRRQKERGRAARVRRSHRRRTDI